MSEEERKYFENVCLSICSLHRDDKEKFEKCMSECWRCVDECREKEVTHLEMGACVYGCMEKWWIEKLRIPKEVSKEEMRDVLRDLELVGYVELLNNEVLISTRFYDEIYFSMPDAVSYLIQREPFIVEDLYLSLFSPDKLYETLVVVAVTVVLSALARKKRELGFEKPEEFEPAYVGKLSRAVTALLNIVPLETTRLMLRLQEVILTILMRMGHRMEREKRTKK